ncbi:MAG: DUF4864 domain-containing protein [Alphaproteobacteria bacterium]
MRTTAVALRSLVIACLALVSLVASAETPDKSGRTMIQRMIRDQIAAFHVNDSDAAFSFASPGIQSPFENSDRFMSMVQGGYPPVYRARSVTFGALVEAGDVLLQQVFLVGPRGNSWVAAYVVEQQPDGSWRIGGVQLARDAGSMI